jgi:hypothetical protein
MANRTYKVKSETCVKCGECQVSAINRDDVFQSLGNAKLYVYLEGKRHYCGGGMQMVEEER